MSWVNQVASIKARVDPVRFLTLLTSIAKRVESGQSESISLSECRKWGFSGEEVIPYLLLLVEAGVLKQRIQVYDHEDDAFEDYDGTTSVVDIDKSQVKVWFKPEVAGESFSHFFCLPSADDGGLQVDDVATDRDSDFAPAIMQFFTVNNYGVFNMNEVTKTNCVNTGDVSHGIVGNEIINPSVVHADTSRIEVDEKVLREVSHSKIELGLLGLGLLLLVTFTGISMFNFVFSPTTISFIRLIVSLLLSPYLGAMAGKAIFSFTSKDDKIPVSFRVTGMTAVFFAILFVLKFLDIPAAS